MFLNHFLSTEAYYHMLVRQRAAFMVIRSLTVGCALQPDSNTVVGEILKLKTL